jgi:hypothetical protein
MKGIKQLDKRIISKTRLSLSLVVVLGNAIAQVHGANPPSSTYSISSPDQQVPVITIHSTGDVKRGKTGLFVLRMNPIVFGGSYVNFSVSGTAIPGVDYVPDQRASYIRQSYSVVMTLQPGAGYALGEPSSAQMMIKP